MNNNEIQKENKKALKKLIPIMIISMLIGGLLGFFSGLFGINALSGAMKSAGGFFAMYIAPYLMFALAILLPIFSVPVYRSIKASISSWDGEDEEISEAIEKKISIVLWMSSVALILSFFLIAATYSKGFASFETTTGLKLFFLSIAAFLAIMIEAALIQQKCVDAVKKMNPEKKASIYDLKFQKKWIDSCDEAEKILIGKCAYKAYGATNTFCMILAIVLAIGALVFDIGFLPSLMVCLIWIFNLTVYCKEALKLSQAGSKIS